MLNANVKIFQKNKFATTWNKDCQFSPYNTLKL